MSKTKKGYTLMKSAPSTPKITLKNVTDTFDNTGPEATEISPMNISEVADDARVTAATNIKGHTKSSSSAFDDSANNGLDESDAAAVGIGAINAVSEFSDKSTEKEKKKITKLPENEVLAVSDLILKAFSSKFLNTFPFFRMPPKSSKLIIAEKRILLPISAQTYDKGYRHLSCKGAVDEYFNRKGAKIEWFTLNYGTRDPLSARRVSIDQAYVARHSNSPNNGMINGGSVSNGESLTGTGSICLKKLYFDTYAPKWLLFFLPRKMFQVFEYSTNFLPYAHTEYYSPYYKGKMQFSIDTIALEDDFGTAPNIFGIPEDCLDRRTIETIDIIEAEMKANNDQDISVPGEHLIDNKSNELERLKEVFPAEQYDEYLEWKQSEENRYKKWYQFCDERKYPYCCVYKMYICHMNMFKGKMISDLLTNSTTSMIQRYLLDLCKNNEHFRKLEQEELERFERETQKFLHP